MSLIVTLIIGGVGFEPRSSLAAESPPASLGREKVAESLAKLGWDSWEALKRRGRSVLACSRDEISRRDGSGRSAPGRLTGSLGPRGTIHGRPGGGLPFQLVSSSGI
jgi:hypothetical protein